MNNPRGVTCRQLALLATSCLLASSASAQLSLFDWTLSGSPTGPGSTTATSLLITGPDNGCTERITYFRTTAAVGGTVSVTVEFQNLDQFALSGHPDYDAPAAWLNGDILTGPEVAPGDGWPTGTYTIELVVNAEDEFGLGVWSSDCQLGPGVAEFHDLIFTPKAWSEQPANLDPRVRFSLMESPPLGKVVSMAAAGDVDGDGTPDIILGYVGAATVRSGATGLILLEFTGPADFGNAVAGIGDIDLDGHDDVIVAASSDDTLVNDGGSVWVYSGADGALFYNTYLILAGLGNVGRNVAGVGDLDGDGLGEMAVRISFYGSTPGKVVLISSSTATVLHTITAPPLVKDFGVSIAGVGDVDNDGHGDVGIGSDDGVFVYSGDTGAQLLVLGKSWKNNLSVSGAGDVDGDGHDDVVLGAPWFYIGGGYPGIVQVRSGKTGMVLLSLIGTEQNGHFGEQVVGNADFNGDGRLDIAVSAPDAGLGGLVQIHDALDGTLHETLRASACSCRELRCSSR